MRKLLDMRRPLGRLCYLLAALLVAFGATKLEAQSPQTTQITDVVYRPDGTPASGTLLISWPSFSTADGKAVAAGSMSVPLGTAGQLSVALVPNVGADPAGTAYQVVYRLEGAAPSSEYWSVPSQGPTTIAAIRSKVVPQNVALQIVSRQYVDDQLALKAADALVLHKSGDESIAGAKTFSLSPVVPTPSSAGQAAPKSYVDSAIAGINLTGYLAKAGGTMSGPLLLSGAPSQAAEAATKDYVDTHAGGGGSSAFVVASTQAGATADAKITAAHTALPSSGGTVWVDLTGNQTFAADPFAGMTKPAHVIFNAGTYTFNANATVPRNVTIEFKHGAVWSLPAGRTVTILGAVDAPKVQLFSGEGKAILANNDQIPVEWYGARNDALIMQSCSMTAGSPVLSGAGCGPYTGPGWTAADVGKLVLFHNYSYSAYPGISHARIVSVTASNNVTLDTNATRNATGVIAYYGTDALPAVLAAIHANKTGHYVFTHNGAGSGAGGNPAVPADYVFSGAVVIDTEPACANGIWLSGNVPGGGWMSASVNLVFPSDTGGFKFGPDCYQAALSDMQMFGLGGWYASDLTTYSLFSANIGADGPHGVVFAGGAPTLENVWVRQFAGHGIFIDGASTVFPAPPHNSSQPDHWKFYNVGVQSNRGYGLFATGGDANAGIGIMVNSRGNQLGAIYDNSSAGNTFIQPESTEDNRASLGRGATKTLSGCSVAANVMTCTTTTSHGFTATQWLRLAGQGDSSFNTDACQLTSVPSTTTFTCSFTHADGSTTGGTVGTSSSGDVYARYAVIAAGPPALKVGSYVSSSSVSTHTLLLNPYSEVGVEAPPSLGSGTLVIGGNMCGNTGTGKSVTEQDICGANSLLHYLPPSSAFGLYEPNGAGFSLNLRSGQNTDSLAPGYNLGGYEDINWYNGAALAKYQLRVDPNTPSLYLTGLANGGGLFESGGQWSVKSGGTNPLNIQNSTGGDTNFYCGGGSICGQFLKSDSSFKATLPDFTSASATRPIKAGTSAAAPASCVANKDLYIKTDAAAGQQLFLCNGTGNGWNLVGDGSSGGGAVSSFNGRTGAVVPQAGDYVSLSETLTNKTLDAEATGNSITLPFYAQFAAAGCNNASASPLLDLPTANAPVASCLTGSNTQQGTLDFDDASAKSAQVSFLLPPDWTGAVDADVYWLVTSGGGANAVKWTVATACSASGAAYDTAFNAAQSITTNVGANNALAISTQSAITTTGCAPDNWLHIKIARDVTDTSTATARLVSVRFRFRRTM